MANPPDVTKTAEEGVSTQAGPNWDEVPFEVGCARCGHDLRGLQEPVCPACDLRFQWADALPLEELTCLHCGYHLCGLTIPRCPECGEPFVWEAVLDDYRRRCKPLFEYRWAKEPLRSLRASWSLAMRPWKLWRTIELHDPPSLKGLLLLFAITAAFFVIAPPVIGYVGQALVGFLQNLMAPPGARTPFWAALRGGYRSNGPLIVWSGSLGWYGLWLLFTVAWWPGGFAGLIVLRQSMAGCKVRTGHVFRICVYALAPAAMGHATFWVIMCGLEVAAVLLGSTRGFIGLWTLLVNVAALLSPFWTLMSTALAYRLYIKMRHAWFVAIASQVIALLVASNVALAWWLW